MSLAKGRKATILALLAALGVGTGVAAGLHVTKRKSNAKAKKMLALKDGPKPQHQYSTNQKVILQGRQPSESIMRPMVGVTGHGNASDVLMHGSSVKAKSTTAIKKQAMNLQMRDLFAYLLKKGVIGNKEAEQLKVYNSKGRKDSMRKLLIRLFQNSQTPISALSLHKRHRSSIRRPRLPEGTDWFDISDASDDEDEDRE